MVRTKATKPRANVSLPLTRDTIVEQIFAYGYRKNVGTTNSIIHFNCLRSKVPKYNKR